MSRREAVGHITDRGYCRTFVAGLGRVPQRVLLLPVPRAGDASACGCGMSLWRLRAKGADAPAEEDRECGGEAALLAKT